MESKRKQRHFVPRELRYSVALIIFTSFLAAISLIYIANEISSILGREISIFLILTSYALLIVFFTLYFAHRFIGPFERLKIELRLFRAGEFSRRLRIRKKDDVYIRSFVEEINVLLQQFENTVETRKDFVRSVNTELSKILVLLEKEENKDELKKALVLFVKRLRDLVQS